MSGQEKSMSANGTGARGRAPGSNGAARVVDKVDLKPSDNILCPAKLGHNLNLMIHACCQWHTHSLVVLGLP
jgi:hypothetical protein